MSKRAILCMMLLLTLAFTALSYLSAQAQNSCNAFPPSTNTAFNSTSKFAIPNTHGEISFEKGGSYANASLNGNVWDFAGLYANAGSSALPNIFGVNFSASATSCNVTITHLDALNVIPPFPGQLDYKVTGVGTQAFNLHYGNLRLVNWTVTIDGTTKPQDDNWTGTPDGWINVTGATSSVSIQWAEVSTITFTSSTNLPIPAFNSSINFASGGTYLGEPTFANNTWTFQNLALTGSVQRGTPLWSLAISVQNSKVTIDSYNPEAFEGSINGSAWLNYTVVGVGSQTVNLGYNKDSNGDLGPYVYIDSENRTQGNGWLLQNDGSIMVMDASSNVSIYYPPNAALYNMPPPIPAQNNSPTHYTPGPTQPASSYPVPTTEDTIRAPPLNLLLLAILCGIVVIIAVAMTLIRFRHSTTSSFSAL